ncbi:MAG: hypothetical protein G01um101425_279 [Candidatus Peregrinibacteria bacterium Gr01-1014_25]|nr:MAG: hypothetical protein G01um101425_279 [Candidatus Peregrinibacteria bacterium Gr01-1014_25]
MSTTIVSTSEKLEAPRFLAEMQGAALRSPRLATALRRAGNDPVPAVIFDLYAQFFLGVGHNLGAPLVVNGGPKDGSKRRR